MTIELYNLDWRDFLNQQDCESVDLVITDPPYESLEKHRAVGTTTRLKGQWFEIVPNTELGELMRELHRVLKYNTHCYTFCDHETMPVLVEAGRKAGFKFWKPLVWDKVNIGMGYHYRCRYEFILFFEKGKRRLNNLAIADVLTCKRIQGGYPTEKPAELSRVLVKQSTALGEKVIDPFMGSGSVGVAATGEDRAFIGSDKSIDAFMLASSRLIVVDGRDTEVLAFPGGRGTADCVRQANDAGLEIIEVKQ